MLSENDKQPNRHKLSELNDCILDFIFHTAGYAVHAKHNTILPILIRQIDRVSPL